MNKEDILNALVRYAFLRLVQREFGVYIDNDDLLSARILLDSIEVYDSWQDFYASTSWEKDNPEIAAADYLTEQKICREIGGHIWYLSRIKWEENAKRQQCDTDGNVLQRLGD